MKQPESHRDAQIPDSPWQEKLRTYSPGLRAPDPDFIDLYLWLRSQGVDEETSQSRAKYLATWVKGQVILESNAPAPRRWRMHHAAGHREF
ncbi:hypothetical protein A2Z33_01820 [Candidatus Gottesmanbacteria bacterium RBG_16_52_11]|uniref:Uncharacterized protein n=1 Tax=Candidatus Gottesmanbacteria bacterium RBG_16_52_11 TaxID=1798374 RepID=A0A1F5YQY7_9BACT|nr:MAG: hypothetical protein A2Z33_01820 [Candidatus Gottesmanbacteria bacterium RBG_16_52_11]